MNAETVRVFVKSLPPVEETVSRTARWGDKLVFRIGGKAVGGKMFSQIDFERDGRDILSLLPKFCAWLNITYASVAATPNFRPPSNGHPRPAHGH